MRAALLLSAAVAGLSICWGLVFLLFGDAGFRGQEVGRYLLGDTWAEAHHLLALSLLQQAGAAATVGVSCMLIALGQAKLTFRLNVLDAPQLLIYPVVGVVLGGPTGAVIGFCCANWVMVPFWYRLLSRAARDHDRERARLRKVREARRGRPARHPGGEPVARLERGEPRRR
jgi:hypothetical protein